MCLVIDPITHPDFLPLVAEKDIEVYKVIEYINNRSIYYDFDYEPNLSYELGKKLDVRVDDLGRHEIWEGFHAFVELENANCNWCSHCEKIVSFTIPKGTAYYMGDNGDIVAEAIRSGDLMHIDVNDDDDDDDDY